MKKLLCTLAAAALILLSLAAAAETAESYDSAEAAAPFTFRDGVTWEMAPDEVGAIEGYIFTPAQIGNDERRSFAFIDDTDIAGTKASLYYFFYDRALYAAMINLLDEGSYDTFLATMTAAYGEGEVLEPGTMEDWVESTSGTRPEFEGDEYCWRTPDGSYIDLVQYGDGAVLFLQEPPQTTGVSTAEKPSWTILLYLCGTDLESDDGCATANMNAILNSPDSDDIRVVIETGGTKEWKNGIDPDIICRYIRRGDSFQRVEGLDSADMSQESTLQDFISWGLRNYPAEHVGLIIWDHGSSSIGGICFDELYNEKKHSLSLTDIGTALYNTASWYLPEGFEFIGFDACLMSSLECANIVAPYARYMYASEETEPGTGWDYQTLLTWLAENPSADGWDFGREQTQSYGDFQSDTPSETFCVIDLSKVGAVVEAFDAAAKEMDESGNDSEVIRAILQSDSFGSNNNLVGYINMIDIRDMMQRVSAYVPSAQAVMDAIENAVVHRINGAQHANAGGLSIYYPIRLRGTEEIPLFQSICPSVNYLSFVSRIAKDAEITGETVYAYGTWVTVGNSDAFTAVGSGFDDDGVYHCELTDMSNLSMASCLLYQVTENGTEAFFGEDDNVYIQYDKNLITDAFDGTWTSINGNILPLEMVSRNDKISVYTAPIMFDGKEMNLRLIYSWDTKEYSLDGICSDVEAGTGMASRLFDLKDGDTFQICYYCKTADEKYSVVTSDDITVDDTMTIKFETLPAGFYRYRIVLYDLSGNDAFLDNVIYEMHDDGTVTIPVSRNEGVDMNFNPDK